MAQGNEFKITLPITGFLTRSVKNEAGTEDNVLVIQGIASDASKDQYNGQMSSDCIIGMAQAINDGAGAPVYHNVKRAEQAGPGAVGLDIDHSDHWTDQIGKVTRAEVVHDLTPEMKEAGYVAPLLMVEAEVDTDMSHGRDLARALSKGAQLGMSVWGYVKDGKVEVNRSTGERTEHFNKVDLRKIAITSKPVNKNTWVAEVRRSMTGVEMPEEIIGEQEAPAEAAAESAEVARAEETPAPDMPDALSAALAAARGETPAPEAGEEVARAEEAPAAEVTEESVEGNTEETVARAEEVQPEGAANTEEAPVAEAPAEETVARAETVPTLESVVAAVLERMGSMPDIEPLSRSMTEHGEVIRSLPGMFEAMNGEIARAMSTIDTMNQKIASLQEELAAFKAKLQERAGRKGIVARAEEAIPGAQALTQEQMSFLVREVAKTDKVAAMNLLLGRVELPVTEPVQVPQELTSAPDNSPVE